MSHEYSTIPLDGSTPDGGDGGPQRFDGAVIDDSRTIGTVIRRDKYSVVHHVTTASWADPEEEVHIFQPRNNKDKRFLQKTVLPKLRKPRLFVTEAELGDGISAIVCRVPQASEVDGAGDNSTKNPKRKPQMPAVTRSSIQAVDATAHDVIAIYLAYCSQNHKAIPRFKGYSLSTSSTSESQPIEAQQGRQALIEAPGAVPEHDPSRAIISKGPKATAEADSVKTDGQRPDGFQTKRRPRALPKDRDLHLIWDLAEMISKEPNFITSIGKHEPGHSFFHRHLSRMTFYAPPPRSVMKDTLEKQQKWLHRMQRVMNRVPVFLKGYNTMKDQTWRLGVPRATQIFASHGEKRSINSFVGDLDDEPTANHESTNRRTRWTTNLDWMIEHNFQGFTQADTDALKRSLRVGYDDTVLSWMRRLISHIRQRAWALGAGQDENQEPVLMDMIVAFTSHEIILGMTPLIESMLELAKHDLRCLERMVVSEPRMLEMEKMHKLRSDDCFDLKPLFPSPYPSYGSYGSYAPLGGYRPYGTGGYYGAYFQQSWQYH